MSSFIASLAGGALIGLSASGLLILNGRVAGISGIVGGLLRPRPDEVSWRVAFIAGLFIGGLGAGWLLPGAVVPRPGVAPLGLIAVGGLLVGLGTSMSGGCTSGHGVCGLSRLSLRSAVAVVTFIATGAWAVFVVRHGLPRG